MEHILHYKIVIVQLSLLLMYRKKVNEKQL
jgi:hypothetical protein